MDGENEKALGFAGLGTLGANYLLAATICTTFPPYILAGATIAGAYGLLTPQQQKKERGGGHGHH